MFSMGLLGSVRMSTEQIIQFFQGIQTINAVMARQIAV